MILISPIIRNELKVTLPLSQIASGPFMTGAWSHHSPTKTQRFRRNSRCSHSHWTHTQRHWEWNQEKSLTPSHQRGPRSTSHQTGQIIMGGRNEIINFFFSRSPQSFIFSTSVCFLGLIFFYNFFGRPLCVVFNWIGFISNFIFRGVFSGNKQWN